MIRGFRIYRAIMALLITILLMSALFVPATMALITVIAIEMILSVALNPISNTSRITPPRPVQMRALQPYSRHSPPTTTEKRTQVI